MTNQLGWMWQRLELPDIPVSTELPEGGTTTSRAPGDHRVWSRRVNPVIIAFSYGPGATLEALRRAPSLGFELRWDKETPALLCGLPASRQRARIIPPRGRGSPPGPQKRSLSSGARLVEREMVVVALRRGKTWTRVEWSVEASARVAAAAAEKHFFAAIRCLDPASSTDDWPTTP